MKIFNKKSIQYCLLALALTAGCSGGRQGLSSDPIPPVAGKSLAVTMATKPTTKAIGDTGAKIVQDTAKEDTVALIDDFGIDSLVEESQNACQRNDYPEAHMLLKKAIAAIKSIDESSGEWSESEDYYKEIANVYTNEMPQLYMDSIPEEISLLIFQNQLANSAETLSVSPADSILLRTILNEKSVSYDIPIVWNARVSSSLAYLSRGGKGAISRWLARAKYYVPTIKKMFADSALPGDLSYLPLIESGFNPLAYSRAHAAGMWQFIASTGTRYGLIKDCWVDERRDFLRSTDAAISYLKKMHEQFNDWHIAIGSYNCGENGMACAINRSACKDYWSLRLPRETMGYVPQFLAAVILAKNPEYLGVDSSAVVDTFNLDTLLVTECVNMRTIADTLGISLQQLHRLNPHILHWCTHPQKPVILYLPHNTKERLLAAYNASPTDFLVSWQTYETTRPNETIRTIAHRFRVPLDAMVSLNAIPSSERLDAGTILSLPIGINQNSDSPIINPVNVASSDDDNNTSARRVKIRYKVRRNDNVASIARKFHVSSSDILNWNHVSSGRKLQRGAMLTLYKTTTVSHAVAEVASSSRGIIHYRVRRGENLASIADKFNLSVKQLKSWNKRTARRSLRAGATLAIYTKAPNDTETSKSTLQPSTVSIHDKKSDKKTNKHPTAAKKTASTYKIKKGDTLWKIARAFNVSAKQLAQYNNIHVGTSLKPGKTLRVPLAEEL